MPTRCRRCASRRWNGSCVSGLPTLHDESWRYTNLRKFSAQSYVDAPRAPSGTLLPTAQLCLLGEDERAATVLMVNGFPFLPQRMDLLVNGMEINSLQEMARTDKKLISHLLEPLPDGDIARWRLLNTALFVDGLYIKVSTRVETPLVILHVATADHPGTAAHSRIIIDASPGSSATIIEHHVQQGADTPLCNSASLIKLERDAAIEHYRVFATDHRTTHLDSLEVRQRKDSRCRQFTIALGGGLTRCSLEAELTEPGAELDSYSLLVGHEERHVDCVNVVRHAAKHTTQPPDDAGDRERHQPRRHQQQGGGRCRRRRRPIRSSPAAGSCSRRPRKSTPGRSSRSTPTRSSARTAPPPAVSIRICSSTCCRGDWIATPRRAS